MIPLIGCDNDVKSPALPPNNVPVIHSVQAFPDTVAPSGTVRFVCYATDEDSGSLTASWSCPRGSFAEQNTDMTAIWIAPGVSGNYTITVKVSDHRETVNGSVNVIVRKGASIAELLPLTVGNSWTYETTITIDDVPYPDTLIYTLEIDRSITWEDEEWYRLIIVDNPGPDVYYRNSENGLMGLMFSEEHPGGISDLIQRYPVKTGDSWTLSDGSEMEVLYDNISVTVPYGRIDGCIVYRERHPADIQGDTWVKTGLGRVKIVMLEPFLESTLRTIMKLIDFHRE